MNIQDKIIPRDRLPTWRREIRALGKKLVVTNGCFDIIHRGHVEYLHNARNAGDLLLVGLNADASVRQLKGPNRPINSEEDRAVVLAALQDVDAVCIFSEPHATRFLAEAEPDIYVKGGDYTLERLNPEERRVVEEAGGRIVLIPFVPGKSTTNILEKVATRNVQ